jgi:branched-chain amino acid transport system ATP-binding protein
MSALLAVEGISKRFRGLLAVANANFEVNPRDIFAIIGPNGAGKTTLFNVISGALRPDAGRSRSAGNASTGSRLMSCAGAASAARSRSCDRFRRLRFWTM